MTKAEIKQKAKHIKLKLRKGDKVVIIAGKDKGQTGIVVAVDPEKQKALVFQENPEKEGEFRPLNAAIKHKKAKFQGEKSARMAMPVPIHLSNLMLLDPKTGEATRVGRKLIDGKVVRYAKKSGEQVVETALPAAE